MQHDPTPTASAGPRVSDGLVARYSSWIHTRNEQPERLNYERFTSLEEELILDLNDSRTALAAANARIAVLEARDVLVQALSVPLGKLVNTHGRVQSLWDASLESGELDEVDFDQAMNDLNLAVDEMYEGCYETVHARRPERLATATQDGPGAAHE